MTDSPERQPLDPAISRHLPRGAALASLGGIASIVGTALWCLPLQAVGAGLAWLGFFLRRSEYGVDRTLVYVFLVFTNVVLLREIAVALGLV